MNKEVTQLVRQIRDEIVANYYRMRLNASGIVTVKQRW